MSQPYDQNLFQCEFCGGNFTINDMVDDNGYHYCKACFDNITLGKGETDV
jgi:formylmethanofuran dehydrogenase subunit E